MVEPRELPELDRLLARYVDGEATHDDIKELEQLLDGNVNAQKRYIHYLDLHAELQQRSGAVADRDASSSDETSASRWKAAFAVALAATVLIAVGLGVGRWFNPRSSDDTPYVITSADDSISNSTREETDNGIAVLTHAIDVEWDDQDGPGLNAILSPGELRMFAGVIQVELYNGVKLILKGPADLEIVSVARVVCREGILRAIVPSNATGFSVLTPEFELVDRGTEFAVDVASDGRSEVHVFDGEIELYLPDGKRAAEEKHVLFGGDAMAWAKSGTRSPIKQDPDAFTTFEDIRVRDFSDSQKRFASWKQWNESLRGDPRIAARYDFESSGLSLTDSGRAEAHGTIVGCEWVTGRWPEKKGLAFTRPGDRVRIDLPGEFDAVTISAWVRLDALPSRRQSFLLTDGFDLGCLHWQVGPEGELRFGTRIPSRRRWRSASGYGSPTVFNVRQIGVWNFVCSVYDRSEGTVSHWYNGNRVSSDAIEFDQPIRIGAAEIGNWGMPLKAVDQPVRNLIGRMDELTIWNVALNAKQISDMHADTRPRSCGRKTQ